MTPAEEIPGTGRVYYSTGARIAQFATSNGRVPDGWEVARTRCRRCGHRWVAVFPAFTPIDRLECPGCGAQDSDAEVVTDA